MTAKLSFRSASSQMTLKVSFNHRCKLMFWSHVAQLVGCWTHNPRVVGPVPGDADCFMFDNILGQCVNLDCASLHPGVMGTWLLVGS